MKKSSFLIRFIDIGLILLFGFVIISDLTIRSQIVLPGHDDHPEQTETDSMLLLVEIGEDHQFQVTEIETQLAYDEVDSLSELEELLLFIRNDKLEDGIEVAAVIHPDENATMQQLIDVLDICDRIGLPKNINVPS